MPPATPAFRGLQQQQYLPYRHLHPVRELLWPRLAAPLGDELGACACELVERLDDMEALTEPTRPPIRRAYANDIAGACGFLRSCWESFALRAWAESERRCRRMARAVLEVRPASGAVWELSASQKASCTDLNEP